MPIEPDEILASPRCAAALVSSSALTDDVVLRGRALDGRAEAFETGQ